MSAEPKTASLNGRGHNGTSPPRRPTASQEHDRPDGRSGSKLTVTQKPESKRFCCLARRLIQSPQSPECAARYSDITGDIDVTKLLPKVIVATLVMHVRGARVPFEAGRKMASGIRAPVSWPCKVRTISSLRTSLPLTGSSRRSSCSSANYLDTLVAPGVDFSVVPRTAACKCSDVTARI